MNLQKKDNNLPSIVQELLNNDFTLLLHKDGFYIPGFYALNEGSQFSGHSLLQCDEKGDFYVTDLRGSRVYVKHIKDIVLYNNQIWSSFYRTRKEDFPRPDHQWLPLMVKFDAINITPGRS